MELAFRLTEHTLESTATSDTVRATTRRDESIEDAEQRDIADAMSNYVYLAEHEVLICKEHGYAVRGLDSHLRLVHKSYASSSKKARAAIRQHYGGRNMPDPSTICPPEPGQPAIEHLSDPIPGYYCIYSHEYTTSVEDAQEDAPPTATDPPQSLWVYDQRPYQHRQTLSQCPRLGVGRNRSPVLERCPRPDILQQLRQAKVVCRQDTR